MVSHQSTKIENSDRNPHESLDERIRDFLAQQRIAVAGVSVSRETTGNVIYRKLKAAGYHVYAVNPHTRVFDDDPCYPDVGAIPDDVDGVVIVTRPAVTEEIVQQCIAAGVPRVWMHQSLLPAGSSVSAEAAATCREHGVMVIAGACPMMFVAGADAAHRCMRFLLRLTGGLPR
jgi:predicted CoA-binding protein